MSMSTEVIGFISEDTEIYQKHAAVLKACLLADIEKLPKETAEFFGSEYPDESLLEDKLYVELPTTGYSAEGESGFEILVADIPERVSKIRFVNSY